ncbi:hypothetical protein [Ruminococcus albus]|uniref:Uncharacterized protein n=1 Tax=Ruminococcus albus (strain ATCC 27210 / DSM 20455 / JCM 14654 / NCDO 2250 / 7) TaxID=697329 RepID=E6UE11_RUMA7|nr:hypothetical protein [Ruminococcus albus]ADU22876.1 hypothetical protein Rumal_2396 [Ruminococcus albus 7 = DSM 20455]
MKLNYRDRIVLTIVIVVLVWVAGVMLFIKPKIESLQDSQAALDDAKATLADLKERNKADKDLKKRIQDAYLEVNKMTESFYSVQANQHASQEVDNLLETAKIENLDMSVSAYTPYTIQPYEYVSTKAVTEIDTTVQDYINQSEPITPDTADAEAGAKGEAVAAPAIIGSYEVSFSYKGKIDDVEKFCNDLQNSTKAKSMKTMIVKNVDFMFSAETDKDGKTVTEDVVNEKTGDKSTKPKVSDTDVEGNMTLIMMVVEKLPDYNDK